MDFSISSFRDDIEKLEFKPTDVVPNDEAQHIFALLTGSQDVAQRLDNYGSFSIEGVGGSGVILRGLYAPTQTLRALKFPRKARYNAPADTKEGNLDVDPELTALEKVSHQNITRLFEAFKLPNGRSYCMITEYIEGHDSVAEFIQRRFATKADVTDLEIGQELRSFANLVFQIADALRYLNGTAKLLHLDIKPDNILVDPSGKPFVTDLGFARELKEYAPGDKVDVGFTWKYAHPLLHRTEKGAKISKVPQRARTPLLGGDLSPALDVFAFGRTLQELLGYLYKQFGERINSQYIFDYLHILACLCLDGHNGSSREADAHADFVPDIAFEMPPAFFARHKLRDFEGVRVCLERLLGLRRFEDDLPEVDRWSGSTIRVSRSGSTTLTPRVAQLVSHPALQRLKSVKQLGMLDTVFPTATHTRFHHTLGTYHAATLYLAALYHDADNPLFRAVVDIDRCKALLAATLIHDVGHTAYGHELEEVDEKTFGHEQYTTYVANSKAFTDSEGRTIRDIVESHQLDGWALSLEGVLRFFSKDHEGWAPLDHVLFDILDSHVDADKFDYLVRDSIEARIDYGFGIDLDRFLHSLTTYGQPNGTLRMAIKQKGAASAEAFAFARYQLYQSLYWHHTFRATKAMLLEAVRRTQANLQQEGQPTDIFDRRAFETAYVRFVIGVTDYAPSRTESAGKVPTRKRGSLSVEQLIERRLALPLANLPVQCRDDDGLKFLLKVCGDAKGKNLLQDLAKRRYYKRLLEVSPAQLAPADWQDLRDKFKSKTTDIQRAVESSLRDTLVTKIQSESKKRETLIEDRTLARLDQISQERPLFLLDIPLRGWYASREAPVYLADYKRRHFRAEMANSNTEVRDAFWGDALANQMKAIAFIRVFAEPEVHSLLASVMDARDVLNAVTKALPELNVYAQKLTRRAH